MESFMMTFFVPLNKVGDPLLNEEWAPYFMII